MYNAIWCDLHFTFDLAKLTFTFKISIKLYLETLRCRKLTFGRSIVNWGVGNL